jgi:peptidoglycan/LPS O-acetylase OafA/YrhL
LRAIAVLAVVFLHFDFPGVTGGFVGVDIFFVISGYLITTIIVGGLASGNFSFARFYERRIRRIISAFIVMLAVTSLAAIALFPAKGARPIRSECRCGRSVLLKFLFCFSYDLFFRRGQHDAPPSHLVPWC